MDALAQHIQDNAAVLDMLRQAAALDYSRYPLDSERYTMSSKIPGHVLGWSRNCAEILGLAALYDAGQGNEREAYGHVRTSVALAQQLSETPDFLTQLVAFEVRKTTVKTLEICLNAKAASEEDLVKLGQALERAEGVHSMKKGLLGATGEVDFIVSLTEPPDSTKDWLTLKLRDFSGLTDLDVAMYWRLLGDAISASETDSFPEMLEGMRGVDHAIDELPTRYPISRHLFPAVRRISERYVHSIATLRTARAALAVERYRQAEGGLPGGLADLVPRFLAEVPEDPFDEQPLRYKVIDGGYMVYSIGPDQADDGGKAGDSMEPGTDITFIVER